MSSEPASKPVEQVAVFDPSVKKKKKKPVVKSAPSAAPAAPVEATTAASPPPTKETPPLVEAPKSVDTTTPTQPAPAVTTPATTEQQPMPAQATPSPITTTAATESWLDSDRDYTYEEVIIFVDFHLVTRFFSFADAYSICYKRITRSSLTARNVLS